MPTETTATRLIDANALIEALKLKLAKNSPTDTDWELWFESAIAEVESITVSDGWIPVSESPEESRFYLVRCPWFCESGYEVSQFSNGRFGYEWNDLLHEEVTHYKPLPNPPTSHQ